MTYNHPDNDLTFWEKIQKLVADIWDHARSDKSPNLYACFAYLPILGWLVAYFFRPKQKLCMFHAYQSFKMNLIAGFVFFIIWFITSFPPISWVLRLFYFQPIVTDFIQYITWAVLIGLSILGAYKAYDFEEYYLPYMEKIDNLIHKKTDGNEDDKKD